MTEIAPPVTAPTGKQSIADEDAGLEQFGYTQKLDRSVGKLASFAIGFATISATTAVFTGFGAGYFTAGAPFVWTLLLAAAVFLIWVFIAADLTAKIPLAGYCLPVDQSDPRFHAGLVHRRDGAGRLGLRHDRRRIHPLRLSRRLVQLEHESDRRRSSSPSA